MKLEEEEKLYGNNYQLRYEELLKKYDTDTHILQEQLDLVNAEKIELQKENEELKDIDLTTVHIKGVCDEKERWRSKIREKIEEYQKEIEKMQYDEFHKHEIPLYEHDIEVLQELLKEE